MSGSAEEGRLAVRKHAFRAIRWAVGLNSVLGIAEAMTWLHQRKAELVDLDLSGDQVLQQLDRLIG